ncbi:MAG: hypothetical protein IJ644_11565 [Oscillospiraceae bacterium]|nr:hypothetical protein [Oscillospiraceae bacterium]
MTPALISILEKLLGSTIDIVEYVIKEEPYGFIEKRKFLEINQKQYMLTWDYILYNEITLEELETGQQLTLWSGRSDKKAKKKFKKIYSKLTDQQNQNML